MIDQDSFEAAPQPFVCLQGLEPLPTLQGPSSAHRDCVRWSPGPQHPAPPNASSRQVFLEVSRVPQASRGGRKREPGPSSTFPRTRNAAGSCCPPEEGQAMFFFHRIPLSLRYHRNAPHAPQGCCIFHIHIGSKQNVLCCCSKVRTRVTKS